MDGVGFVRGARADRVAVERQRHTAGQVARPKVRKEHLNCTLFFIFNYYEHVVYKNKITNSSLKFIVMVFLDQKSSM